MANGYTREELFVILKEQIELLQLNAQNYDAGKIVTTLQIATAIRVLFHDTSSSVSLIRQLCEIDGVCKDDFEMVSSKTQDDSIKKVIFFGDGLCAMSFSNKGIQYIPKYEDATFTAMPFSQWWNEDVLKDVSSGFETPIWLNRKTLITLHSNKEGGAHVDKEKNEIISNIGTEKAAGWISFAVDENGNNIPLPQNIDQKRATVRQICYEVLYSLHNHFPDLFLEESF